MKVKEATMRFIRLFKGCQLLPSVLCVLRLTARGPLPPGLMVLYFNLQGSLLIQVSSRKLRLLLREMSVKFIYVIFGGIVLSLVDNARILPRVKRQSLKVRITAKDDSIVLQYLSSIPVIKLQGYVLGLGGRFSKQNITLPGNGDPIEVDVDFNPKYLVAVHPVAEQNSAAFGKKCKGSPDLHKPPQITIDPRTPTSVFLTWAQSFKDKGFKVGKECENERQYTIRYREKERDKKWKYHLCPSSETTIDHLKPNTVYEFGIRVTKAKRDGVWSRPTIYTTTMTPQPRSSKNDQNKMKSNKVEVNFISENPKHPRKPGPPGMTNIKGITATKKIAPNSAHNRTNWKLLPPKKPELSTKAIVGSQSTSNSANIQPGKSSSPKPVNTSKPEHANDFDKEGKKEETTNIVSKPSMKGSKTRKENGKPAMKPLTTKGSKLSSSARPSFSSKSLLNSDRTESETPSSTIMPFITLRTTSDHKDVGNQDLPEIELPSSSNTFLSPSDTISALDSMEAETFSEPEMPATSSQLFDPISEPDDMDTQKIPEPKIRSFSNSPVNQIPESVSMEVERFTEHPSSISSFSSSSNMVSKPDIMDTKWFTAEHEEPSSRDAFYISSPTTSAPDNVDNKQFTEHVVESTTNSLFTTSKNAIYESDSPQRKQISVPEFEKPFLSIQPVNTLKSSKNDEMEPRQSKEAEVSPFTTSKVFITSSPTADADVKGQQSFADHEFPVTDIPNVIYPIPELESAKIRETETTDDKSTFRTPKVMTLMSGSMLPAPGSSYMFNPVTQSGHPKATVNTMPSSNTPNLFRLISGYKPHATKPPNLSKMVPESEPANIRVTDIAGHMEPTTDTPSMFRIISGSKPQDIDTPNEFSLITESVPAKMRVTEDTDDLELSTSHTSKVFTLMSGYELQATDSPNVINPIPEPNSMMIGEAEVTDIMVPVTDISNVPIMLPEFDTAKIEDTEVADHVVPTSDTANVFTFPLNHELLVTDVINPIPELQQTNISNTEVADFELPVTKNHNVLDPNPKSEATRISYTEVTDNVVSTSCTPKVLSLIPDHDLMITGTPNVINPIPETEPAKIRDTEVADSDSPATDIPNKINPTPKSEEIRNIKVTDDEVPSSDFPAVLTLMPDHELPITHTPNMIYPIPEPEHANIKDTEVTDHLVLHSPNVVTLTPDHELIVTDTSNAINPITEIEHVKLRDTEIADYRVKISDAANMFTLIPVGELPATDIPNVTNPIPEPEHAKIRDTEVTDHEPSTIKTTKLSNPTHAYSTREKKLRDRKLPSSDTSHVFIPILVSEPDHIEDKTFTDHELTNSDASNAFSQAPISENSDTEDQEIKAPKATNSETSRMFSSTPRSELDNKEDKEIRDYKLPIHGAPNVFSQSQESAHDNTEVEDLADYGLSPSDTPNMFQSTPVSQLGKTEEKDLSVLAESDSPSDSSPFIATNPKPETDAKVDHKGPETLSTVDQLSSTISGRDPENPLVFRSTPVSNIDGQGQERFRGPYMKYMSKKKIPCSITESLKHFPEENITNEKALTAPRYPPSNLTLVTVEGCPTFLIVDWMSNKNDTASEYEVVSQMQGPDNKTEKLITLTNQTHAAVENLKPNTSYTFSVTPTNVHGRGPSSDPLPFVTETADPSVSEYIPGKDAIWTQYSFKFDSYSECQGKRFVKRTRYRKFVGIVLCNSLRYKIYLSNSLSGIFYNIGDLSGHGEDHCQFVDSFLDGRTGEQLLPEQLPIRQGFYRSVRQEPVMFGTIGGQTHINYVHWYECGIAIPGQW